MGDRINITNSGTMGDVGSRTTTYYGVSPGQASPGQTSQVPGGGGPLHLLYAFADIVGYSKLNARLQTLGQDDLVNFLNRGMAESGVEPEQVEKQDQGDARLLTFPMGTDVTKVLAVLPRVLNDDLTARNRDMADHARMRVRVAFSVGASVTGSAGLVGSSVIAVTRIANSDVFRKAMAAAPRAECGLMIDNYLYEQCVRQGFRADIDPGDYVRVAVSIPEKGFDGIAWLKLFGYSGEQVGSLVGLG